MKTLVTIIFSAVFLVPGLFIVYGLFTSVILFFIAVGSGDYLRFFGVILSLTGGGMGFFASVELLGKFIDQNKTIRPLQLKLFLLAGLSTLIFILVNSTETLGTPIIVLLLMPIPVVLYLMQKNKEYLWIKNKRT